VHNLDRVGIELHLENISPEPLTTDLCRYAHDINLPQMAFEHPSVQECMAVSCDLAWMCVVTVRFLALTTLLPFLIVLFFSLPRNLC
jgi:hypothetical protein